MKNKLFFYICATLLLVILTPVRAQNLLDLGVWTIGTGSAGGFGQNGATSENTREWGVGPQGQRTVLWKASPGTISNADGGWNHSYIPIDHTKMYRLSVWIKKTNSSNGTTYFGPRSQGGDLKYVNTGTVTGNPYFFSSDLPQLDKWYLLVSYVHGSGDNSTGYLGKIYDGATGEIIWSIRDFKFQTSTTHLTHRAYLYYDTNPSDRQYFYAPRIDEVNGDEPSITELLGISPSNPDQLMVGTNSLPSGYALSVGGDAIMEKVKVQVETAWPDYVFDKNYPLKSIEELKKFIAQKGHLPGLPSASEVESNNQDLGLIQQKLLEKIEELTLYIIKQEERDSDLELKNAELLKRIERLEKLLKDKN